MMNILMLSGDRTIAQGKTGPFHYMLQEFSTYWDRVDIISPYVQEQKVKQLFGNVFSHPSPYGRLFQPLYIYITGKKLIEQRDYNLVISHDYGLFYNGSGAWLLHHRFAIPWVSEIHHVDGYPLSRTLQDKRHVFFTRMYMSIVKRKVVAFRTVSKQVEELLRSWDITEKQIVQLSSLYLDFTIFSPQQTWKKKYDLIFCARLEHEKGVNLLLNVIKILCSKGHRFKYLIVGQGKMMKNILRFRARYQLENAISLIEWVENMRDMAKLYNQSRILICTSSSEGNPRVVAEAMACGVPVVSTPVGIVPELIKNGRNGLVTSWKADDIAAKIEEVLLDDELYRRLSQEVPLTVRKFEKKNVIRNLAHTYQHLGREHYPE